jgi:hypothetical protein
MFRASLARLVTPLPESKCMIGRNRLEAIRQHDMFHNEAQYRRWASWRFMAAGFAAYFAGKAVLNVVSPSHDSHH